GRRPRARRGRRALRAGDRGARHEADRHRPLVRRADRAAAARPEPRGGGDRDRSGPAEGRPLPAALGAAGRVGGVAQPGEPQPCRLADPRSVPLRLRERDLGDGVGRAVRALGDPVPRPAAVRGCHRQPLPRLAREGRDRKQRPRAAADHGRRQGPHRPRRRQQANPSPLPALAGRHRLPRVSRPRPLADDRRWLARGRRRLARRAVLLAAVLVAGPAGAGLPPAADDPGPTPPRATSPPPTPSSRAVAALRDETNLVPAGPVSSPRPLRPAPVPVPQARLYGRAPVDAVIPTTVVRKQHRKKPKKPPPARPLQVTPPLDGGPYIFPVAGTASFGDTYGGLRSDVPGGWHHGDDIFAPLGTPVVAVADGTVNRAGWERVGGWRLWVRDDDGDEFYYAHLSGYARVAFADGRVHRGEVIGFVGNTGDAFATLPHLHFEVHPRSLLRLKYDGAVDPTTYLQSW